MKKNPYLTSLIPKLNNKYYNKILIEIKNDFTKARNAKPDNIVVLAHMGIDFSDSTDIFQKNLRE
jgi:hypothetical protein